MRTSQGHLNSLNSRLGKAARIGGAAYVERFAYSDTFASMFLAMDAAARKKALETVSRVIETARATPPKAWAPSPDQRVKIRWTGELIAQFRRGAPWCRDNKVLAIKLGYPAYCHGCMRAARSRYLPRVSATRMTPARQEIRPLALDLAEAA
jgi:hypothetical protein